MTKIKSRVSSGESFYFVGIARDLLRLQWTRLRVYIDPLLVARHGSRRETRDPKVIQPETDSLSPIELVPRFSAELNPR